jgi:hypothetical protein
LQHREEAEKFYRDLAAQRMKVRVGMEASGHARWFERLLAELNIELWIGDAAEIRTRRVRKQKTDRQDAQHILQLLVENRFPQIWVPSWENRDLRQLLWYRHRMVQARTRLMNQLQAVALNEGLEAVLRQLSWGTSVPHNILHFSGDLSGSLPTKDGIFPRFSRIRHNGIIEVSSLLYLDAARAEVQSLVQALFNLGQITVVD